MAAAATQSPAPPGFFTFLKHGVLLPARNRGLFLPLLALTAALTAALLVTNSLAVQPLAAAVIVDADALSRADPRSAAYPALVERLQSEVKRLLLEVGAFILAAVVVGSAVKISTVFAAVAAFSAAGAGAEHPTVSAVVAGARGNLWGPVLTVAFGYVLEVVCGGAMVALAVPMVYLLEHSLLLLFLDVLLLLLASLFLVYLAVVCTVAVAVSAAEPGRRGAGAVSRAWRLMERKKAQAAVYLAATAALGAAVSPVYTLALRLWPRSAWGGVAAGAIYVALLGAVEVFSVAAITAYYFECRQSKEEEEEIMARHRYAKLPSGDEANI